MSKHPWAGQMWGSRAGSFLRAVVMLVLVLSCAAPLCASRPVRPAEARVPDRLHRGIPRRVVRDDAPRRSSRAEAKAAKTAPRRGAAKEASKPARGKAKSSAKQNAPAPARGRKSRRREPEPENDPPLIHRASARNRREKTRPALAQRTPTRVHATIRDFTAEDAAPTMQTLPQASADVTADVKEFPVVPAARPRVKQPFMTEDHAARQAAIEQAVEPVVLPTLYSRRGRLVMPPPLKGSRDILIHQNTMADTEGLDRIQDDEALEHMQELHLLVPLRDSASLIVNDGLPENRRYARPWAARFAMDLGRAYYVRFHQPIRLNSAVRTIEYQLRLQRTNGNAAAVDGDGASPHLTGQALDFGKRGMSMAQIAWMRAYLGILMRAGKIDVEEEFQQACFHISVYKSYLPTAKKVSVEVAEKR